MVRSVSGLAAEVQGCTDSEASNYNADATVNSGCIYIGVTQPNDSCSNAIAVACGETLSGNTGGATSVGGDNACGGSGSGVWYTLANGSQEQLITVSTCGSLVNTVFQVFQEVDAPDATLEVNSLNTDNFENISAVIVFNGDTVASIPAGTLFPTLFNDYYYGLSGGDYTVYFTNEGSALDGITANVISSLGATSDLCFGGCSTDPSVCLDLQINPDAYPGENSFDLADAAGNVVWSGDVVAGPNSLSTCVPPGTYTFTMYDSFGDGMCCTYGDGNFTLSGPDGELATGGTFGDFASTTITLEAVHSTFLQALQLSKASPSSVEQVSVLACFAGQKVTTIISAASLATMVRASSSFQTTVQRAMPSWWLLVLVHWAVHLT